ncbi:MULTISPECIES: succinate dehydrogenase, cytochrome b556 subunit [Alphaproteobacteria]|uniref:Succinate dehydrogenase cytochrome b556 subunit n=2 Tax=Alphaproteobacteria TaxID=28211 RepID=A0A512HD15_9HYPH|nr:MULTISPECIES: succinate dehydrogenase, cytochrome b556 subunit [Alphaproteobacteria]GEO83348.1 succinate dehydrogenase, cytochrome b556 subunit [Ciceribacter naphthalenivorans]GLR20258.1 succinate dehydrogenase, cytochrome b556 subunit [Ciceribacter naphthalenivorans]GLT03114.1 succinate dehydrogenase, cytochrome b556 subunit [Sphingomonas psychrolutea]
MQRPQSRPTSPHLTIWRWQVWAISSITHRITGIGLYIVGIGMFTWYLMAAAMGPNSYATFVSFAGGWLGQLILVGLTWSLFQHMSSGIRHFFMDVGKGYGRTASSRSAAATFICSLAITAVFWSYIWIR